MCDRIKQAIVAAALMVVMGIPACWPVGAVAAEPDFVGVLALAVGPEVAKELELTEAQRTQLLTIIADREDADELTELVLVDLTAAEREERLGPFRQESERQGLAVLTPQQQARLRTIRVRRLGLASLAEPAIAGELKLTEAQRSRVAAILKERRERLAGADEQTMRVVRAESERSLRAAVSDEQWTAWEKLTSGAPGPAAPEPAAAEAVAVGPGPPRPAPPQPPDAEPGAPRPPLPDAGPSGPASPPAAETEPEAAAPVPRLDEEDLADLVREAEAIIGAEEQTEPGTEPSEVLPIEPPEQPSGKPTKLRFKFRHQPWKDVVDWFVEQSGLSLVTEDYPTGTFNYTDDREYTPAEALDVLNSVLLTKNYTLVRRQQALMLINLEDGIPPNLVSTITPEELDERGEFELVRVLFDLDKLSPEEAESEIGKLVGPQGSVVALVKSRQILVTETAGRLRAIRAVIQRVEGPEGPGESQFKTFEPMYATLEEVVTVVRQLLDIPEEGNAASDGSIRFAQDPLGERLLVTGTPEKLKQLEEIIQAVDVPGPDGLEVGGIAEAPQLEVYIITTADPEAVLAVIQTLLAGLPDVRLAIDPKTRNLVALARPAEHATIRATLDQMQRDARQVEVIHLRTVDPQLAVLSINKLFGAGGEKPDPNAPQVDADPTTRQLLVRATEPQIEQIRALLEKMGESDTTVSGLANSGNVRTLPLTGRSAYSALERAQEIWPTMRRNPIRVVTPSAVAPSLRPRGAGESSQMIPRVPGLRLPAPLRPMPGATKAAPATPAAEGARPAPPKPASPRAGPPAPPENRSARLSNGARVFFVSQPASAEAEPDESVPGLAPPPYPPEPQDAGPSEPPASSPGESPGPVAVEPTAPTAAEPTGPSGIEPPEPAPVGPSPLAGSESTGAAGTLPAEPAPNDSQALAPIIVAPGPGGVTIASGDIEALDAFEQLFSALAGNMAAAGPEVTIFYLVHAKAAIVAQTLDQIFGGGTLATEGESGGGGLIGDLAGAALGDSGGGILGAMLGLGGGGSIAPSGPVRIIPDTRLNALLVEANPADLETIERLLEVLDQKESPEEILVVPKARMIPVVNTQADEIAEIVKEVFRDRMVATSGSSGGGRPSPEDFIRMLRGGRNSRGGSRGQTEDVQKMSIGVDARTNSLIVAAPDQLFQEVKQLVTQLDEAAIESQQAMRVVTLRRASPEAVQRALSSMLGGTVQFGSSGGSSRSGTSSRGSTYSRDSSRGSSESSDARRAAFIEMMRQRFRGPPGSSGPPGGGSFRGPPGSSGPPGGGSSRRGR